MNIISKYSRNMIFFLSLMIIKNRKYYQYTVYNATYIMHKEKSVHK